jgi:hypothetical protein
MTCVVWRKFRGWEAYLAADGWWRDPKHAHRFRDCDRALRALTGAARGDPEINPPIYEIVRVDDRGFPEPP